MNTRSSRAPLSMVIVGAVACLALVGLLVVSVTVGVLMYRGGETGASRTAGPVETDPGETDPVETSPDEPAGELILPPGVAEDQPYLELSSSEDGPVVDVYRDFLCPPCKDFQRIHGDDLIGMALQNTITLRVHPRPMLDDTSTPPGYSSRAAHAAVCAYAQNPEKWFPAEIALFDHQPGNEGLPDHEIIYLVSEATGLDIADCYESGDYHVWLQDVVEPEAQRAVSGTPAVLIDGRPFTGDMGRSGTLKQAIEEA
ncbi:MAG: thioredoxin domain-containing protein [Actinomycetales bacterium]|nr:thioredoxin domain-containing protein [Actinomycetales bacterium]